MKRAIILAALALMLLAPHARAQMLLLGAGSSAPPPPSFTGVADEETTINHYWGTVAPGRSYLGFEAVSLCNNASTCGSAGVGTCLNVKTLSPSGQLDVSVGDYCDSGTETVTTWCSTNCVHGGTARLYGLCDQFNGSSSTCPNAATPASYAVAPDFVLSGVNSKPTWGCVSSRSTLMDATVTSMSPGYSVGATFERNLNFTGSFADYFSDTTFIIGGTTSVNQAQGQQASASGIPGTASDGTTSTFSNFHVGFLVTPTTTAANAEIFYIDGASVGTATLGFTDATDTTIGICAEPSASGYADAYMTRAWTDPTVVGSTVANAVSNLTTVPLP
jgi:hypothetical protein